MENKGEKSEYMKVVNIGYVISVLALLLGMYFIKNGYAQGFILSIVPVIFGSYILSKCDKQSSRYGWGLILLFIAYIFVYMGYFAN